jgi:hypothetical protein
VYCQSKVEERIEIASEAVGFRLEYHSPSEIDDFERRLETRYAEDYAQARAAAQGAEDPSKTFQIYLQRAMCNPKAPRLTRDEVRFMQNELHLVMCDAAYFLTRYYWILDRENLKRRFTFQAGQRILFEVIAEMESLGIAIEIILAKARQLGMTTLVGGLELLKVMFSDGVSGIVASADRGKTKEMVSKIFYAYDKLPWWMRPLTSKRVESDQGMIGFAGLDSKIIFQHGKQTNPIAMGSTPVTYHLSEVSSYPDAENLIEVGLFKCVHPSTRVFGVLESTCKGDSGWWYDTYWNSKSDWKHGGSRLMALFLPFFCGTDMYPNETWLRKSPIPANWRPDDDTRKMIAESEMYVQTNPLLEKVLRKSTGDPGSWRMPVKQAWYWEQNWKEHRSKGAEKTWFSEMPHCDVAAFQGSYDNVFGREVIAEVWSQRKPAYGAYSIIGQSIEDRHEPDSHELDLSQRVIPVTYSSRKGETYRWEFWPMKWTEPFEELYEIRDEEDHMGKLFIWHHPEPGYDYSIGVDTSNGIGSDATCIAVARRGRSLQEQDVQAAEFRSNRVSHVEAFAWVMAIAAYYSRYMEDSTRYREPYVSIEQIAAVGDTCQLQMANMGYGRFHKFIRYDSAPKHMRKDKSHKRGWYTNAWSRPLLTDGFVTLVVNGWYKVNSPYTMREMSQWEVHYTAAGKDKLEHSEDATDDGIFANAMAGFCPNDTATMAERGKKHFGNDPSERRPPLDLTVRSSHTFNPDATLDGSDLPGELRASMGRWT